MGDDVYFPPPDAEGGWRRLDEPSEIRTLTGIDKSRLDQAFQYTQTSSQHGGLLVVRHGYLVYEKYFGRANREANPNMYSIGKMFTSACCGIMLAGHGNRFPDGLSQKAFHRKIFATGVSLELSGDGGYPAWKPAHHDVRAAGLAGGSSRRRCKWRTPDRHCARRKCGYTLLDFPRSGSRSGWEYAAWEDVGAARAKDIFTVRTRTSPPSFCAEWWRLELQEYIKLKLGDPMGWGRWGYAIHQGGVTLPHTPGAGGIALHSTDALRFGYLLLKGGKWKDEQLVPAEYVALLSMPSPFNPHSPFSLQHEVNADGHVAGAPRDTFFKSGAGGFGLYVIPSLDMVVYKMSSLNAGTYDPAATGLPLTYTPDTSRDDWQPHPFNQFVDGPIEGDSGVRRALEMVVASVVG